MTKTDMEETLANEIGHMGDEISQDTSLGKLKHKSIYGGKEDLMENSLL